MIPKARIFPENLEVSRTLVPIEVAEDDEAGAGPGAGPGAARAVQARQPPCRTHPNAHSAIRVYPHVSGADIGVRTGLIPIDGGHRRRQP